MSVLSVLQNLANSARVQFRPTSTSVQPAAPVQVDDTARSDFLEAKTRLLRSQRALEELADVANVSTNFRLNLPDAVSSQGLGLNLTDSAATLNSTEEINTAPRSFSPFGPDWLNGSSALLTIGGLYDGTDGTGAITFDVSRPGTRGVNNLQIRVNDPQGSRIGNFNIRRTDPLTQQYDLGNGLFFTVGAGDLIDLDNATLNVFDSVGAAVNPDNPLGGVRNSNPNLDLGVASVVDGSFQLNGETINVSTTDSINDVINSINLSNAGVTAVFNPTTERIEFAQNTNGSAPTIDIQGDTSNFIAATKLDAAIVTPGTDRESDTAFSSVAAFSSITTGNIVINGTSVAVDSTTDSLTSVLDKINAQVSGVTATFDEATQRVTLAAEESAGGLNISSNGTGLFEAIYIPQGAVDPERVVSGISLRRAYEIADAFETLSVELNELFQDKTFKGGATNASPFRSPLDAAINAVFGDAQSIFGLTFDRSADALRRGDFASIDRRDFTRSLQFRNDNVKTLLEGDDGQGGLIGRLYTASAQALRNIGVNPAQPGARIDVFA